MTTLLRSSRIGTEKIGAYLVLSSLYTRPLCPADIPADSTLDSNSSVGQLTIVPLQNTHPSNGVIEPDRVLMISGLLKGPGFDQASTALFDGQTLVPYTVAVTTSGAVGYVATLFHSISTFSFVQRRKLHSLS